MTTMRRIAGALAALWLLAGSGAARAQGQTSGAATGQLVRIEARFVDRASGQEAGWGATGQILVPPPPDDPALLRWRQARVVATSPTRQSLTLAPGGRGLIRVGREIPFSGWFLRHGIREGWIDAGTAWREVESSLEVEIGARAAYGTVRLVLTPEFSYLAGRSRRSVSFPGESTEVVLSAGVESRFVPSAAQELFYSRLLDGYDPLRRVWQVDLALRVDFVDSPEPGP